LVLVVQANLSVLEHLSRLVDLVDQIHLVVPVDQAHPVDLEDQIHPVDLEDLVVPVDPVDPVDLEDRQKDQLVQQHLVDQMDLEDQLNLAHHDLLKRESESFRYLR
jgi:hypothetical protein